MLSWLTGTRHHKQNVAFKQKQRNDRIAALTEYHEPISELEQSLLDKDVVETVKLLKASEVEPRTVLKAFGKKALLAHEHTEALTEIMIKDAEIWADQADKSAPLAGFPVSLKDPFIVGGYDATAGYSSLTRNPFTKDGSTARLIKDAGGVPYVKTNVPITMMAIEGYNDVFGTCKNPHNAKFAPGGSSQGEGALIGYGGSRIGIGTDIGGSVRVPAAWSGIYSLRMSTWRFPLGGDISNDKGFEGVPAVASPMARSIGDLRFFLETVMSMKPWTYEHRLIPLEWRKETNLPAKPKVGVLKLDDLLPLTPAQQRALDTATDALKKQGYEVVPFKLPEPSTRYDRNVFDLYGADRLAGAYSAILRGEHNDPYVSRTFKYTGWPRFLRRTWEFVLWLFGFTTKSEILGLTDSTDVKTYYDLVHEREVLRAGVFDAWKASGIDFLITAPHQSPAVPLGQPLSFYPILYTSLFNLLDMPAGILPVGRVSKTLDKLPSSFNKKELTPQGRISFDTYDAAAMEGLPTSVQVVGPRYFDEETLAAMELVVNALKKAGKAYK